MKSENVIDSCDLDSIYKIPMYLHEQGLDKAVVDQLNIWTRSPNLDEWKHIVKVLNNAEKTAKIGVVGKYVDVIDSYKSINETLVHAGIANNAKVDIEYIDATTLTDENVKSTLSGLDGVIVPGGFGNRGIEGKMVAIKYLRENKIPFLGICLGMQLAAIEFARNGIGIKGAGSAEFDAECPNPIIHLMEDQKSVTSKGGTYV